MLARARNLWESLRASYWFLPTLMSLVAVLLSILTIRIDTRTKLEGDPLFGMIYSGGPEGSRAVLSVIAGSMITVTGIVFSITIVALSLASSQLGPRILRAFIRDRGNQFVFGTFISTFVYCLLVLRTIRSDVRTFVPNISVTVGILLSLLSLGVLIYFIHHIAKSVQADYVVAHVGTDLRNSIERRVRAEGKSSDGAERLTERQDWEGRPSAEVRATEEGYVRALDEGQLLKLAARDDLSIVLEVQPGDFLTQDQVIARILGQTRQSREAADTVRSSFVLGPTRTQTQDLFFLVDQLVQVALRALSPGINDPLTAINCIDYLVAALAILAESAPLSPHSRDADGRLRVVRKRPSFERALSSSLGRIRQYAGSSLSVLDALLEAYALLFSRTSNGKYQAKIREEMEALLEIGRSSLISAADKRALEESYARLQAKAEESEPKSNLDRRSSAC